MSTRQKRRTLVVLIALLAFVLIIGLVGCGTTPEDTSSEKAGKMPDEKVGEMKMPDMLIFGSHEVGSGGHKSASIVAESIQEQFPPLKVRLLPSGPEVGRSYMTRLGDTHVALQSATEAWFLQEGLHEYSRLEWGPQPVRYLYLPIHPGMGFAIRGDSGINTFEDLRGKKVGFLSGAPAGNLNNEFLLAFGGLTWDDVEPVIFASVAEAYEKLITGEIDTNFMNVTAPAAYEGASSPAGLRYLEMPQEDQEGWARARAVLPYVSPVLVKRGAGISEDNPIMLVTMAYPAFIAWSILPENIAYWITKAVVESYDNYVKKDKKFEHTWVIDLHWDAWEADIAPLHEGAVRYFKEIGQWTDGREQMNNERIKRQEQLRALWDTVVEEAVIKGIKSADFPKYWLERKTNAGL